MSDCRDLQYVVNSISSIEKRISALMTIVSFTESTLHDEVERTKEALKTGTDSKLLLDDALNTMSYKNEDIDAYSSFMYSILEEMRELADKYGRKNSDHN